MTSVTESLLRNGIVWKNSTNLLEDNLNSESNGDLSKHAKEVAERELREIKGIREQSLQQFRDWIMKNEDIGNVRIDDRFLLRFLRVKKFNIPLAQQILLKYLNYTQTFSHVAKNLDCLELTMGEIMSAGCLLVSPHRDKLGRRVIIIDFSKLDPFKYDIVQQARALLVILQTLLEEPENQVLGIVYLIQFAGIKLQHIKNWPPTETGRLLKWGEHSIPGRFKEVHCISVPTFGKWILEFFFSHFPQKYQSRFHVHKSLDECDLDRSILPLEMGGKIPTKEMIDWWKKELIAKREIVLNLDNGKLLSDKGIITRHSKYNHDAQGKYNSDYVTGGFKKLEID